MRRLVVAVALAACGSPPAAKPPAPPAPAPVAIAPRPAAPPPLVFRQLHLGRLHAARVSFELALGSDRATLVETDETADANNPWAQVAKRTYAGARRGADLDLRTADMQPLPLHCVPQTVELRGPHGCSEAASTAYATEKLDALACSAPGQAAAGSDADADDLLVFSPAPGLEWYEADGCSDAGLQRAH